MDEIRLHDATGIEFLLRVEPVASSGYSGYWRCSKCDFDGWTTSAASCEDQAREEAAAFFHGHAMIYHARSFKRPLSPVPNRGGR